MSGVLIADEPGLGKTVQALAVLKATEGRPAVIVCPSSLRTNWEREARRWLPGWTVDILYGTRPARSTADIQIVGYDVLHAWTDTLAPRALVLDELHLAKNGQARRTQAAVRIADACRARGGFVVGLTGTPVLNNVTELVAQLRILGRLDEFGGAAAFRREFSNDRTLPALNRRLRATCYVRRRKADVLTELPAKRWATVVVDGDPGVMREYRHAEADIVAFLANRARELAAASGATDDQARAAAWRAALKAEAAQHLVAVTALKRLAARAKLPAARGWISDFTGTGKKLVAFAWHREAVDMIATEFAEGCAVIGGMTDHDKQAAVDRFQNDDDQKVIACSIKAAGVGLTLTAAADVLFLEQGWTPADMDQASDRCHRIGQHDSVTAWNMVCADTIDEAIANLIAQKRTLVDAATDGDGSDGPIVSSVLGDLLVGLAERAGAV